jgi:peptidoglycan biosynthesis protein MviN/MurJ (putative lipid II flippase)
VIGSITHRLRALGELDRALARNVLLLGLFVAVSGAAKLAQEMVIAWKYGASADVDAYYFVSTFLNWPVGIWFSVLVTVVVPLEAGLRRQGADEVPRFRAELLGFTLSASIVVTLVAVGAFGPLLAAGMLGLGRNAQQSATSALPVLAWLVPLGLPIGLCSAWIIAAGRHTNTLLEGVPATVVIGVLLVATRPGIEVLLWATAAGVALRLIVLGALLRRRGELPRPRFAFAATAWGSFWRASAAMVVGQVLITVTALVDQLFAARLGEGAVATLSYANRIILMAQALMALIVQRATLPLLAESFQRGAAQARRALPRWTGAMFLCGAVLAGLGWLLATPLIALLFERGAFTPDDTARVSQVLAWGLLQMPFYLAGLVYVSFFAAQSLQAKIALAAAIGCATKLAANALLVPRMGLSGLQLATAAMYLGTFLFLHWTSMRSTRREGATKGATPGD